MFSKRWLPWTAAAVFTVSGFAARQPGDPLRPGFNLFSKQQDLELGQANAKQVLEQYPVVKDEFLQDYVRRVGDRLAQAPEAKQSGFQFTFTVLNVPQINAFALPGGPMFIYTGLLKACDNEAQLAGVMGHEMSHVILRHGTHEASKANLLQLPLLLAGSVIGSDTAMGRLANMGLGLGANSFLLKFSRDAESEADALGSHLMAEAGYDPVEMARFFEKLSQGPQPPQILSDHPNPGNRETAIKAEMRTLPQRTYGYQTGLFPRMKTELAKVPPPPQKTEGQAAAAAMPPAPSGQWKDFRGQSFAVSYPSNWQVFGDQGASSVTIAPKEGVVNQNGATQVGYGAILSYFTPDASQADLRAATDDLIHHLRADNPKLQTGSPQATRVAGANGLITTMTNDSPFGGAETDALLTILQPQGLFYMVFIAPEKSFSAETFRQMRESLRFSR
jgi:peptidase M48-like protein